MYNHMYILPNNYFSWQILPLQDQCPVWTLSLKLPWTPRHKFFGTALAALLIRFFVGFRPRRQLLRNAAQVL